MAGAQRTNRNHDLPTAVFRTLAWGKPVMACPCHPVHLSAIRHIHCHHGREGPAGVGGDRSEQRKVAPSLSGRQRCHLPGLELREPRFQLQLVGIRFELGELLVERGGGHLLHARCQRLFPPHPLLETA